MFSVHHTCKTHTRQPVIKGQTRLVWWTVRQNGHLVLAKFGTWNEGTRSSLLWADIISIDWKCYWKGQLQILSVLVLPSRHCALFDSVVGGSKCHQVLYPASRPGGPVLVRLVYLEQKIHLAPEVANAFPPSASHCTCLTVKFRVRESSQPLACLRVQHTKPSKKFTHPCDICSPSALLTQGQHLSGASQGGPDDT